MVHVQFRSQLGRLLVQLASCTDVETTVESVVKIISNTPITNTDDSITLNTASDNTSGARVSVDGDTGSSRVSRQVQSCVNILSTLLPTVPQPQPFTRLIERLLQVDKMMNYVMGVEAAVIWLVNELEQTSISPVVKGWTRHIATVVRPARPVPSQRTTTSLAQSDTAELDHAILPLLTGQQTLDAITRCLSSPVWEEDRLETAAVKTRLAIYRLFHPDTVERVIEQVIDVRSRDEKERIRSEYALTLNKAIVPPFLALLLTEMAGESREASPTDAVPNSVRVQLHFLVAGRTARVLMCHYLVHQLLLYTPQAFERRVWKCAQYYVAYYAGVTDDEGATVRQILSDTIHARVASVTIPSGIATRLRALCDVYRLDVDGAD